MDRSFQFLLAFGECHRRLNRHAIHLQGLALVRGVQHVVEMPDLGDAYRYEEYVDAELVSGEALSWCLEITMTETTIAIGADVTRIHAEGQDVVRKIGEYEYSAETDCLAQLRDVTERLCSTNPLSNS